jgi:hypothetical protein
MIQTRQLYLHINPHEVSFSHLSALTLFTLDPSVSLTSNETHFLIHPLSKNDHSLNLSLQDDVVFDYLFIKVDDHIFAYYYLPFASILLLYRFL